MGHHVPGDAPVWSLTPSMCELAITEQLTAVPGNLAAAVLVVGQLRRHSEKHNNGCGNSKLTKAHRYIGYSAVLGLLLACSPVQGKILATQDWHCCHPSTQTVTLTVRLNTPDIHVAVWRSVPSH